MSLKSIHGPLKLAGGEGVVAGWSMYMLKPNFYCNVDQVALKKCTTRYSTYIEPDLTVHQTILAPFLQKCQILIAESSEVPPPPPPKKKEKSRHHVSDISFSAYYELLLIFQVFLMSIFATVFLTPKSHPLLYDDVSASAAVKSFKNTSIHLENKEIAV